MLTGDRESAAMLVAQSLGITNFLADCTPQQKVGTYAKATNQRQTSADDW